MPTYQTRQWALEADPQLSKVPYMVQVPVLLPRDRELQIVQGRIQELLMALKMVEPPGNIIRRLGRRMAAMQQHISIRTHKMKVLVSDLEQEWVNELTAAERLARNSQQTKSGIKKTIDPAKDTQQYGSRPVAQLPERGTAHEIYGVCEVTENYKKTISSLRVAVEGLDEVLRFPTFFNAEPSCQKEVLEMRHSIQGYVDRLRSQLDSVRVVGTPMMSPVSKGVTRFLSTGPTVTTAQAGSKSTNLDSTKTANSTSTKTGQSTSEEVVATAASPGSVATPGPPSNNITAKSSLPTSCTISNITDNNLNNSTANDATLPPPAVKAQGSQVDI
ncbi:unnamed protein product, partial [Mesorhabditis spiculigera]